MTAGSWFSLSRIIMQVWNVLARIRDVRNTEDSLQSPPMHILSRKQNMRGLVLLHRSAETPCKKKKFPISMLLLREVSYLRETHLVMERT